MRELMEEVCRLQLAFSASNTPEMQRRGILVRHEIPAWLRSHKAALARALGRAGSDIDFQGRDGTGQKTEIPWIRFYSAIRSPNAREGWYCVYLFHAGGAGAYLWIGHGSTTWDGIEFRPRPKEEVAKLRAWGIATLGDRLSHFGFSTEQMDLGARSNLGTAYARSNVAWKWYPAGNMPNSELLLEDAVAGATLLGALYESSDIGASPDSPAIEAQAIQDNIRHPGKSVAGQGIRLNGPERRAVELRAMRVAEEYLRSSGFDVTDVSQTRSYHLLATKEGVSIIVEVKGSTGPSESIILTANEVAVHTKHHPNNALLIVHTIKLDESDDGPRATGGHLVVLHPWSIVNSNLRPIAYQYVLTPT